MKKIAILIMTIIISVCSCDQQDPIKEQPSLRIPSWLIGEWITDSGDILIVGDGNILIIADDIRYNLLLLRDEQGYTENSDLKEYSLMKGDTGFVIERVRGGICLYRHWDKDFIIRFDFY